MDQASTQTNAPSLRLYTPFAAIGFLVGIVLAFIVPLLGSLVAMAGLGVVGGKYLTVRGSVTLGVGALVGATTPMAWLFGPLFGAWGVALLAGFLALLYAISCLVTQIVTQRT